MIFIVYIYNFIKKNIFFELIINTFVFDFNLFNKFNKYNEIFL